MLDATTSTNGKHVSRDSLDMTSYFLEKGAWLGQVVP